MPLARHPFFVGRLGELFLGEFLIDGGLERFKRLRAVDHLIVDEEVRRSLHAQILAGLDIGVDAGGVGMVLHALVVSSSC